MITMFIADDELINVKALFNEIIKNNNNIQLVGISNNGVEIYEYLKENVPDILILDLKMPKMTGIELLDRIRKNKEMYFPKLHIIVISGYLKELYEPVRYDELVYATLSKPYLIDELMHVINNICTKINSETIRKYVNKELNLFEFNVNSNAYNFLKESIYVILYDGNNNFNLEKDIYVKVAKKFKKKNIKSIKWSIEKLMNKMYINTRYEIIQKYFRFQDDRKPSTKLFIRTIVDKYMNNKENNLVG